MVKSRVITIQVSFEDRDQNRAKTTFYVLSDLSIDDAYNTASSLASAMAQLSNARIVSIDLIIKYKFNETPTEENDDIRRKMFIFLKDENGDINTFYLPWPRDVFETEGKYSGIRVDPTDETFLYFCEMFSLLDLRNKDGSDFGELVIVAGLAL